MHRAVVLAMAFFAFLAVPAHAVQPEEILEDPALEERARDISQQLRCLVCQNESIDSSNADVARDLRRLVRERLVAGESDEEVMEFIVGRYGDFVLLNPPLRSRTLMLWLAPLALFVLGAGLVFFFFRRPSSHPPTDGQLSAEEESRLKKILNR